MFTLELTQALYLYQRKKFWNFKTLVFLTTYFKYIYMYVSEM